MSANFVDGLVKVNFRNPNPRNRPHAAICGHLHFHRSGEVDVYFEMADGYLVDMTDRSYSLARAMFEMDSEPTFISNADHAMKFTDNFMNEKFGKDLTILKINLRPLFERLYRDNDDVVLIQRIVTDDALLALVKPIILNNSMILDQFISTTDLVKIMAMIADDKEESDKYIDKFKSLVKISEVSK